MNARASHARGGRRSSPERALAALVRRAPRVPFGPAFFMTQLAAFLRDHCPAPEEGLSAVTLVLADGATLDVCHVEGLASQWLVIAAFDGGREAGRSAMRTEFVPYESIVRVMVRVLAADAGIGFRSDRAPRVIADADAAGAVLRGSTPGAPSGDPRALPVGGASATYKGRSDPSGAGGTP